MVSKILPCFPDYGKCAPEYVAAMVAAFSLYSEATQARMASVEHGLVSKHPYVPTVADVRTMGDEFKKLENTDGKIAQRLWVDFGTPAWYAWQKTRPLGTPSTQRLNDKGEYVSGWYFPTEYPPTTS
jgi:hypothetical protein